jgi:hypothetical protein
MSKPRVGGCLCGAVRYESEGEVLFALRCHCRDCQRQSGSASVAAIRVPSAGFRILKGAPKYFLITHHPQPNPGIAKRQGISVLEPSEGCLLYPSPLFQPAFQPAATCQGRVQRARAGVYRGLARYAWLRMVRNQVVLLLCF